MKQTLFAAIFLCSLCSLAGRTADGPLVVDVSLFPPCVMKTPAGYTGFDIDLWEKIAAEIGVQFSYREVPFTEVFHDIQSGTADVVLGGVSIREDRERYVDFSHAYLKSGLYILALGNKAQEPSVVTAVTNVLLNASLWKTIALLIIALFVLAFILWVCELGKGGDAIRDTFWGGMYDASWCMWAQMTTMGFGDIVPKTPVGRMLSLPGYVIGVIILALVVSSLSSSMTLEALEQQAALIQGPGDLFGKKVAIISGTTSEPIVRAWGAQIVERDLIEDICALLLNGDVDAVVCDAPAIKHFVNSYTGDKCPVIVGEMFDLQDYGIVIQQSSELRERINRALLKLQENGVYQDLSQKWFGSKS